MAVPLRPHADTPKCYLVRGPSRKDWGSPGEPALRDPKALMLNALVVILFVAMVLTPAVIAARSGRDLHE
jgi:hypothetical protein